MLFRYLKTKTYIGFFRLPGYLFSLVQAAFKISLLLSLFSFGASAQPIAQWSFNNTLNGTSGPYNSVHAITLGSGIGGGGFYGSSEYYGEGGWPSGALSPNAYVQFRLAPLPGYQLNVTSIVLRLRRSITGIPPGSGPTRWALRSNLDGYTADIATGTLTTSYQDFTINPGSAFMGLTGNLSFRLYGYQQTTSLMGENRLVMDEISVYGLGSVLPVKLSSFAGHFTDGGVQLKWNAADVSAGTVFFVERLTNGQDYVEVGTINGHQAAGLTEYGYLDQAVPSSATNYYRLKVKEASGAVHYSAIISITTGKTGEEKINFVFASATDIKTGVKVGDKGLYQFALLSTTGTLVYQQNVYLEKGEQVLTLTPPPLLHGSYVLFIRSKTKTISKTFVY